VGLYWPHDNIAVGGKLDCFHRIFRSLSGTKDAADNALMMEHSAFGHGDHNLGKSYRTA